MKVGSTDASSLTFNKMQNIRTQIKETDTNDSAYRLIENKNISQLTEQEIQALPVSEKIIINAIEKANKALSGSNRRLEYSVHEKTKEIMVKVIDSDTNEIVREFPPEKILDMIAKMWEMAGIIVDERR